MIRRVARVSGAAALVCLAGAGVIQASAADTGAASVTFGTPASSGQTISTGPVVLSGTVSRPGGVVDSVQVLVHWYDTVAGRPKIAHPDQQTVVTPQGQVSTFPWTFPLAEAANGQYEVVVTGTTDDGTPQKQQQQNIASSTFLLDIAPVAPANLVATVQKADRTIELKWTANPEPDLIGYDIFRAGPSATGSFAFLNGVYAPATSFTDSTVSAEAPGTYRYELVAVRPGAQGGIDHLKYSTRSNESDGTVSSPPVTPTTTTAPSEGGVTGIGRSGGGGGSTAVPVLPGGNGLSDYQALVNQANATAATTVPPDPGFSNKLPYQPRTSIQAVAVPGGPDGLGAADTTSTHRSIEFIAAALLLAVAAGFALLIKKAVEQPLLEPSPVEDVLSSLFTPAGPDAPAGGPVPRPLRSEFRH